MTKRSSTCAVESCVSVVSPHDCSSYLSTYLQNETTHHQIILSRYLCCRCPLSRVPKITKITAVKVINQSLPDVSFLYAISARHRAILKIPMTTTTATTATTEAMMAVAKSSVNRKTALGTHHTSDAHIHPEVGFVVGETLLISTEILSALEVSIKL